MSNTANDNSSIQLNSANNQRRIKTETVNVLILASGPFIGMGFGRFAYALILPAMRLNLHWSLAISGAIGSANTVGYFFGAIIASPLAKKVDARRLFAGTMLLTAVSILLTGVSTEIVAIGILRFFTGVFAATTYVVGAGIAMRLVETQGRSVMAKMLGLYVGGIGVGIIVSGIGAPYLIKSTSSALGWRLAWISLGAFGVILTLMVMKATFKIQVAHKKDSQIKSRIPHSRLMILYISYGFFGLGYVTYMTFIIVYLTSHGASTFEISLFWVFLGIAVLVGSLPWSRAIARLAPRFSLSLIFISVGIGASIPILFHSLLAMLLSALLFGGSFLSVVAAIFEVSRRKLLPSQYTASAGALTAVFAIGQIIGPVLSGIISSGSAGLNIGFEVSAGLLFVGSIVVLLEREEVHSEVVV